MALKAYKVFLRDGNKISQNRDLVLLFMFILIFILGVKKELGSHKHIYVMIISADICEVEVRDSVSSGKTAQKRGF